MSGRESFQKLQSDYSLVVQFIEAGQMRLLDDDLTDLDRSQIEYRLHSWNKDKQRLLIEIECHPDCPNDWFDLESLRSTMADLKLHILRFQRTIPPGEFANWQKWFRKPTGDPPPTNKPMLQELREQYLFAASRSVDGESTPSKKRGRPRGGGKDWLGNATLHLILEPNANDAAIARKVGITPSVLSRSIDWQHVRKTHAKKRLKVFPSGTVNGESENDSEV